MKADAIIAGKALSTMTVRDLDAAAKRVRGAKRARRKKTPEERADAAAERALVQWLRRALARIDLPEVRIAVTATEVTVRVGRKHAERAAQRA